MQHPQPKNITKVNTTNTLFKTMFFSIIMQFFIKSSSNEIMHYSLQKLGVDIFSIPQFRMSWYRKTYFTG
jgi:hypothetical protein